MSMSKIKKNVVINSSEISTMNPSTRIAVILPLREHFRSADAGAVALTVKDFYFASTYCQETIVFGGFAEHFPEVNYHHVKPSIWRIFGQNIAYAKQCVQDLVKHQVQMVEVHNRVQLALRIKKALPRLKVAIYLHNDPHTMAGLRTAQERAEVLEQLDLVYCVSQYVQNRLLEDINTSYAQKSYLIYNAISHKQFIQIQDRQQWITYAGRFVAQKGVLELAQALAQVLPQYPEWKAVFLGAKGFGHEAGQSKYEQAVYAQLAHVASQIEFRGHVKHDEVMDVYSQTAIAVTPSIDAEAFGRTTLEAMDSGCAVISSTIGGLAEVAGDAAILVNPVNSTSISDAISSLINDRDLRLRCAKRCQDYVRSNFSLIKQTENLDASRKALLVDLN